jgi:Protein of unknown function (DUF4446)
MQELFAQYALYAWLVLLGLVFLCLYWLTGVRRRMGYLAHRYANLTKGVDGANLLDSLDGHLAEVRSFAQRMDALTGECQALDERLQLGLRKIGMVRFNPFGDTGGDQSFAIALLDERGDGIVLSSIFGRAESRLYAKAVKGGKSKYALSDEEEQAIIQATLVR